MNRFLFIILILVLNSCSFQPRGHTQLSPYLHKLYLTSNNPNSQFYRYLRESLQMSGIQLNEKASDSNLVLTILNETLHQQLLSIGTNNQTRQYNVSLTISYSLSTHKGINILGPEQLTETRSVTIQSNQILGDNNEVSALYQQMRLAIAFDLIDRLASEEVGQRINAKRSLPP